jgi:hypothetical protein
MKGLHEMLQRFSGITPPEILIRREGVPTIEKIIGTKMESRSVLYQQKTIFIQGPSVLKHVVSLKKEELLEELRKQFPSIPIHDIR